MSEEKKQDWAKVKNTILNMAEENEETKDLPFISRKHSSLLFVYDSMKKNLALNKSCLVDNGAQYICNGYTESNQYCMGIWDDKVPVVFHHDPRTRWFASHIQGELWVVPTKVLTEQDYLSEGMFRTTTSFVTDGAGVFTNYDKRLAVVQSVYMYVGVWKAWEKELDANALTQGRMYRRNDETIYYYMWTGKDEHKKWVTMRDNQKKIARA